jgi:MFS family permease
MSERAKVSAVVCLAAFMAGLDLFIVNLAFPRIGQEFRGTSLATLSWVLSAYAIVYAALLVPAGRFADRTGRRRSFLLGLCC